MAVDKVDYLAGIEVVTLAKVDEQTGVALLGLVGAFTPTLAALAA